MRMAQEEKKLAPGKLWPNEEEPREGCNQGRATPGLTASLGPPESLPQVPKDLVARGQHVVTSQEKGRSPRRAEPLGARSSRRHGHPSGVQVRRLKPH